MFDGKISLGDCLDRHQSELERQKKNLSKMQAVSEQIITSHISIEKLPVETYLEQIEKMEKEGMDFMDVGKKDTRKVKRAGAIVAGIAMILLMLIPVATILWATTKENVPGPVVLLFIVVPIAFAVCILAALIKRMKEIEGGEEDEASKY